MRFGALRCRLPHGEGRQATALWASSAAALSLFQRAQRRRGGPLTPWGTGSSGFCRGRRGVYWRSPGYQRSIGCLKAAKQLFRRSNRARSQVLLGLQVEEKPATFGFLQGRSDYEPEPEARLTTWGTVSSGFREIEIGWDRLESVGLLAPFLAPATPGHPFFSGTSARFPASADPVR
jgi:hypothetical protein